MIRDELRAKLIAGANELLSHTWVIRGEQRRLVQAQLAAYGNDGVVDVILANLPSDMGAQTKGSAEMAEKKAIDWAALVARLQELATKIPSLLILVSQLVELFGGKQGQQATCPPIGPDNCCDHEACCLAVLTSALQTAAIAAEHYEQCCCDTETAE